MPERILLLDATLELLGAALIGDDRLARAIGGAVASGWLDFPEALTATHRMYSDRGDPAPWGTAFFLTESPRTLFGWGGFKGSPNAAAEVEIGYALAPSFRGRGLAQAAARLMVSRAFGDASVKAVTAHTLAGPNASASVLERLGFIRTGEVVDPDAGTVWAWRLAR